jgi:hypothetical protein
VGRPTVDEAVYVGISKQIAPGEWISVNPYPDTNLDCWYVKQETGKHMGQVTLFCKQIGAGAAGTLTTKCFAFLQGPDHPPTAIDCFEDL